MLIYVQVCKTINCMRASEALKKQENLVKDLKKGSILDQKRRNHSVTSESKQGNLKSNFLSTHKETQTQPNPTQPNNPHTKPTLRIVRVYYKKIVRSFLSSQGFKQSSWNCCSWYSNYFLLLF